MVLLCWDHWLASLQDLGPCLDPRVPFSLLNQVLRAWGVRKGTRGETNVVWPLRVWPTLWNLVILAPTNLINPGG